MEANYHSKSLGHLGIVSDMIDKLFKVRQELEKQDLTLPNQLRKEVKNPTTRWTFAYFSPIYMLYLSISHVYFAYLSPAFLPKS